MSFEWYTCANGEQKILPFDCSDKWSISDISTECGFTLATNIYRTICSEGYCVSHDNECMRPCGSQLTYKGETYVYNVTCPGWDKCVRSGVSCQTKTNCPADRPYACYRWHNGGNCMKLQEYCRKCDEGRCGDGKCMSSWWSCDGIKQCSDGADEKHCGCAANRFRCGDGTCIYNFYKCDGQQHCNDGADELNCATAEGSTGTAAASLIIGGVVAGLIILILICLIIFCKYRDKAQRRGHSTSNSRRNPAVLVSGTSIRMPNRGISNPSYNQPAPPYSGLQPQVPTQPGQTGFPTAPYPQQLSATTSPYSQPTDAGAFPYSPRNAFTAPPYPTAPYPSAPDPTPSYQVSGDAPPSYDTVMSPGGAGYHSGTSV